MHFQDFFLGSNKHEPADSRNATALHDEKACGGPKKYKPPSPKGRCAPPSDKFGRFLEEAHSQNGAKRVGPFTDFLPASPKETALKT